MPDGGALDGGELEPLDAGLVMTSEVRASRATHSASEQTIAREVVNAAPKSGATDLLRLVPGMVASQHSGEGKAQQLFLRGFDAVHGQDVELNVAGLPVNEVSHLHALGYADVNWLIPEAVREVRVTEGSYRAFQGDFAVAGTVRYELGLEEKGFTAAGSVGSFGRYRGFLGFRPFDEPETFAALEYVQGDGVGAQRAFGRASFLGQAVFRLGEVRVRAVAGSYAARFDSPGVVRDDALRSGAASFFQPFGRAQGGASSRHQVLLSAELPGDLGKTTVEVFGVLSDLRLRNNFTGFLGDARGDGLEQTHRDGVMGARLEHHRHFTLLGGPLTLDAALGGRRDGIEQSQRAYRDTDGAPYEQQVEAKVTQSAMFGWVESGWSLGGWRFLLGGRADVLAYEVFDGLAFANPRFEAVPGATRSALGVHLGLKAGIERALGANWRLFINYGDGFRSPQARSLADGERAPFVNVRGAEVGATFERRRFVARAAAFGSLVENDFFFDHSVGSTVFTGATLRGGVSASVTAHPLTGWLVSASGTAAHARVVSSGALLPYFAPLVGRLDTSYTRTFEVAGHEVRAHVGAAVTAIGPRPLPFSDFSSAVGLVDARLGARVGPVEVTLDVQNLLDARWRDGEFTFVSKWDPSATTSLVPSRHFTAGSPRTLSLTAELHL